MRRSLPWSWQMPCSSRRPSPRKFAPAVQRLTLNCYETLRVQMSTKKDIAKAEVRDERSSAGLPSRQTVGRVDGLAPGTTQVTLTDVDGKKESFEVTVSKPRELVVTVGQTVRLQRSDKKPIAKVFNEKPGIVRVAPMVDDPTTILVTGLCTGHRAHHARG